MFRAAGRTEHALATILAMSEHISNENPLRTTSTIGNDANKADQGRLLANPASGIETVENRGKNKAGKSSRP
jgi:hypothetical protein